MTALTLDVGERNMYSFLASGWKQNWMGFYEADGTFFILHLTNKRIILEPHQFHPSSALIVKALALLATSDADTSNDFIAKNMEKKFKKDLEKNANNQEFYSLSYRDIENIDRHKRLVRIIKRQSSSNEDPIIISLQRLTNFAKQWGGLPLNCNKEFIKIANELREQ